MSGDAAATTDKSLFKAVPPPAVRELRLLSFGGQRLGAVAGCRHPSQSQTEHTGPGIFQVLTCCLMERVFKAKSLINKLHAVMDAEDFCCRREDFEEAWQKVGPMLALEGVLACSPKDQD